MNTSSERVSVRAHSDRTRPLPRGRVFPVSTVAALDLFGMYSLPGAPVVVSVIPVLGVFDVILLSLSRNPMICAVVLVHS